VKRIDFRTEGGLHPDESQWIIVEGEAGVLIVTSWSDDGLRSDRLVLERFAHEIVIRTPECRSMVLKGDLKFAERLVEIRERLKERGVDPKDVPPMLVHTETVKPIMQVLGIVDWIDAGAASIFGVRIAWHKDLDCHVEP